MNFSAIFISRPIGTTLLAVAVVLLGAIAFRLLPVSPLPQVDFPTINVQASLPGASPDVMAATVATPLERTLGRISGITEMTSSSSLGSTNVTLQFDLAKNINDAARGVQAAINAALPLLPSGMIGNPTYRKVNPADAPIMILSLTSKSLSLSQLYDAASTILAQKISQISGIGQVNVGGGALPAVRVNLDLNQLNNMGLSLEQVRQAIATGNNNSPKGAVEDTRQHWQIQANDQLKLPAQYDELVVAYLNGVPVRLQQVSHVSVDSQNILNMGMANGEPSIQLIIFRQPGANIIDAVEAIKAALPELEAAMPAAVEVHLMSDRTITIRASLHDSESTLILSVILVALVVLVFMRDWRATLIPVIAVPISLVGTFAAMYLLGYSLDNLSLMALIVATGFVVDDAVVVLENIMRHVEEGVAPMQAALRGAREVSFTVVSMSLSLAAVFLPVLLMGGIIGRLFREFAATLSIAIFISLLVSLTLTPMLASRLLKRHTGRTPGRIAAWGARGYASLLRGYGRSLTWALKHHRLMLLIFFSTIALNVYLFMIVPKGFFPTQDTGVMFGTIQADQAISFQAMSQKLKRIVDIIRHEPGVQNVVAFTGGGSTNAGFVFLSLQPYNQRVDATTLNARLRKKLAVVPGAQVYMAPVQDIRAGGRPSPALYQFTLQSGDLNELRAWEPRVLEAFSHIPILTDVNTDQQSKGLQIQMSINREAAAYYGISVNTIDQTLNDAFGQRIVSTIYEPLNQYRVVMGADKAYLQRPDALNDIYLISAAGQRVPLSALASFEQDTTPLVVNHQGLFAASTISFNLEKGASLGQAQQAIAIAMAQIGLPSAIQSGFQGTAKLFQDTLKNQPMFILTAILVIYIVLGMLYESTIHPLTILSTLPSAGIGAIIALMLFHTDFSIIALIGVFLLIGIVKKNAILMVDFALQIERDTGASPSVAIHQACLLRLRPILMTTFAALFTALPLAMISGNGAELRQPLGISIAGGLIVSQLLTLYTTPVIYLQLDKFRHWSSRRWAARNRHAAQS
ncbi:MAG: MMPL family transporter [Gallionella sp.]|nr:MMPL family transporter [Gallionella sp.]